MLLLLPPPIITEFVEPRINPFVSVDIIIEFKEVQLNDDFDDIIDEFSPKNKLEFSLDKTVEFLLVLINSVV